MGATPLVIVASVLVDLAFLVILVVFFAVCVAYVRLCDRIIGPDPHPTTTAVDAELEEVPR
jgi:hypothetical protein